MNIFGKKVLPILVFLGILVPSSVVLAATTTLINNTSGTISDNNCFDRTFDMLSSVTITDIMIEVDIDHTYRADLDISLISPQTTSVDLTSDNGGSKNNLYVKFDDDAATSIVNDNNKHTATVERRPELALSAFDGEDAQGTWTLHICDDEGRDTGTFNYAVLDINDTPQPPPPLPPSPVVEYKMDECYWLGGTSMDDVTDSSASQLDGTSHDNAQTFEVSSATTSPPCFAGRFDGNGDFIDRSSHTSLDTGNTFSISSWVYANDTSNQFEVIAHKTTNYKNGFTFYLNKNGDNNSIVLLIGDGSNRETAFGSVNEGEWFHAAATYDGNTIRMYINGSEVSASSYADGIANATVPFIIGEGLNGNYSYDGDLDEVKVYDKTLTAQDIKQIYNYESSNKNYDGTPRTCPACETDITAGAWEFIGVPADFRTETNKDVADVFEEFVPGDYGDPNAASSWVLFKRTYSDTNNSSKYDIVPYTGEALEFGQGYWLKSRVVNSWSENGLQSVDYNSTDPACPTERCVEIDLKSVNLNFDPPDNDPNDGTGTDRNNMLGFPGKTPVEWADCRIVVDGTAYTPTDANASGFIDKQIWQYNPGAGGADANGYTTCDDSLTTCKLEPYKGFWLVLSGKTKNKTVKLLIPQE